MGQQIASFGWHLSHWSFLMTFSCSAWTTWLGCNPSLNQSLGTGTSCNQAPTLARWGPVWGQTSQQHWRQSSQSSRVWKFLQEKLLLLPLQPLCLLWATKSFLRAPALHDVVSLGLGHFGLVKFGGITRSLHFLGLQLHFQGF